MRILLLKPQWFVEGGIYRFLHGIRFTPLNLGILAALSEGHEVRVVDGDWAPVPYEEDFDLVGITVTTFTSARAYGIADRFREKGSRVVMGGVHPSILPRECLEHCDAVVVGEAEYVWQDLLRDAERGTLKAVYRHDTPVDMNDVPSPRRDLLSESSWFACVQATRGCVNRCRYCYLPMVPWRKYRKRDVDLVYEELKACRQHVIFFVDDNLFVDRQYAIELFKRIAPLGKLWSIQAPTAIAKDDELLEAMGQAGFFGVQVGFQTINDRSLQWARVHNTVEQYRQIVSQFHKHKILVCGFFIFGFDDDTADIFKQTAGVIVDMDLDDAHLYILTPYPGTEFHEQLKEEGRLLEGKGPLDYGWANAVFKPKRMSPQELEQGVEQTYEALHGFFRGKVFSTVLKRLPWAFKHPSLFRAMMSGGLRRVRLKKGC